MDLLKTMLKDLSEDMQFILDNLGVGNEDATNEIDNLARKNELEKYLRSIEFACFVLSHELNPPTEKEINEMIKE